MYAAVLVYCHALQSVQDKERVLAALTSQAGRVLSLLMTDVLDGSVAMRAVASSLLCYLLSSSPSSTLSLVRHSSLLSNLVSQLVKRDDDLRLSVLSGRPVYSTAVSQYGSVMALLLQVCWVRGGRDAIVQSEVLDSLTRLRLWQLLADLPASAAPAAIAAYYRMLIPFLRLLVGMLASVHSGVLASVVEFLRQHRELVGAVVKGGRGQIEPEEMAALTLMAQLLERVEAVDRQTRKRSRDHPTEIADTRMSAGISSSSRDQTLSGKPAAVSGVTGHLRGLLKYVGVNLSTAAPPTATATSVLLSRPAEDVVVSDVAYLQRYHKLLMLQLPAFVQSQSSADFSTAVEEEQLVAAVLSLACLRLDLPRGSDVLLSSSLDSACSRGGRGLRNNDMDVASVDVSVGALVDVLFELAGRVAESNAELFNIRSSAAEEFESDVQERLAARVDRCVYAAEHGLLLLSHHVSVYTEMEGRPGLMSSTLDAGQWRERAAAVVLPLLAELDRTMGGVEEVSNGVDGDVGAGGLSASTALVVSSGVSGKSAGGMQSQFGAALTKRTRKALL